MAKLSTQDKIEIYQLW